MALHLRVIPVLPLSTSLLQLALHSWHVSSLSSHFSSFSLQSRHACCSSNTTSMLVPQDLWMCCALFPQGSSTYPHDFPYYFFRSLLNCHLGREGFPGQSQWTRCPCPSLCTLCLLRLLFSPWYSFYYGVLSICLFVFYHLSSPTRI